MKRGYYAILPANVRYDKKLTPNAKLLYAEITALCNKEGYCWATNEYFADLYSMSKSSISRNISSLVEGPKSIVASKGFIISSYILKEELTLIFVVKGS